MSDPKSPTSKPAPIVVLFGGWLLPGLGHMMLGRKLRGALFLAFVVATSMLGNYLTGGAAISPVDHPYALIAELPAGMVALVPAAMDWFRTAHRDPLPDALIANLDLGMVFCMMAGLWNALLAHDAFDRAIERRIR